jgi:hypothetical protein
MSVSDKSSQPEIEYRPIRYLNPARFQVMEHDQGLRVVIDGEEVHDHVLAYACFPISDPRRYISLRVGVSALDQKEIGMIRDLSQLTDGQRRLVSNALAKRYFVHTIAEIYTIREEFGYLYWDDETDKGRREFPVKRWDQNRVREFEGPNGEIGWTIIDADKNRYEIPDMRKLDSASRSIFYAKIHWGTHDA